MQSSLELGRTMPQTPLDKIVEMMVLYEKRTGNTNKMAVENIIRQTLGRAGGQPGEAANEFLNFCR